MWTINIYPTSSTTFFGEQSAYKTQPLQQATTCTCEDRNELQVVASSTMHSHSGSEIVTWYACHTCGGQDIKTLHFAPGEHSDNRSRR